jgi:TorA maturation chaperone TorD
MRDHGLSEAIRVAGGVSELARRLGISQPSVSNWNRVPAERVLDVETVTGVERLVLRPDLYADNSSRPAAEISEIDSARGQEYALLAALLVRAPNADLLDRLAQLRGDASPLGIAHSSLAQAAADTSAEKVEREYFNLFIGLGRGELLPYGSYYLTGFLHERPLARLRADLNDLGVERATGVAEPEDHVAILCEVMAGLLGGKFPAGPGADREFFEKHMRPWFGRFFADLEQAEGATFYRRVGTLGRSFVEIETEAYTLPA